MELNKYQQLASRTLPLPGANHAFHAGPDPRKFGQFDHCVDLLHASLGIITELGEAVDPFKRHVFYGMELEEKHWLNMKEEAGDMLWYIGCLCRGLNCTMEELAQMNIAKLAKRYPERFTSEAALNRNTQAEVSAMEAAEAVAAQTDKPQPVMINITQLEDDVNIFYGPDGNSYVRLEDYRKPVTSPITKPLA